MDGGGFRWGSRVGRGNGGDDERWLVIDDFDKSGEAAKRGEVAGDGGVGKILMSKEVKVGLEVVAA